MNEEIRGLVDALLDEGILLGRDENPNRLRVISPLGRRLDDRRLADLEAHKVELLRFLAWQDAADRRLLESTRKIAEEYPPGCPLVANDWAQRDTALHAAYWSQELGILRRSLAEREAFARDVFAAFRREGGNSP
jgi:hypothetical protein